MTENVKVCDDSTSEVECVADDMGTGILADKKLVIFAVAALIILTLCCFSYGFCNRLISYGIVTIFTAWMSVSDINERMISNKALLLMFAFGLANVFLTMDTETWIKAFLSGLGMFFLMLVMYFISMRTLGFGDVKLLAIIAFILGFGEAVQLVFVALLLTVVCGFVMFIMRKASMKTELPMVPYLLAAIFVNSAATLIIKYWRR